MATGMNGLYGDDGTANNVPPCVPISMIEPKPEDIFFGKHFCGKRGGSAFKNVTRPVFTGKIG